MVQKFKATDIQKIIDDVRYIKKALAGNGEKGLIKQVADNSEFRIGTQAKSKLIWGAVGTGWAVTIVVMIWNLIPKGG